MELLEIRSITKQLLRDGKPSVEKFEQALPYCKKLYEVFGTTNDLWDVHQYANCLKQLGNLNEAEIVCDSIYQQFFEMELSKEQEKPWTYIKKLYAWIIFEKYVKTLRSLDKQPDKTLLLDKMAILCKLIVQEEQKAPSLSFCILQGVKYIVKNLDYNNYGKALSLLTLLKKDQLSQEPRSFINQLGKTRELASEMEEYYQLKSEILLKTKRYDECIACCNEAMESISTLHYNNDVWFERRVAQAFSGLGDIDKTIEKLNKLAVVSDKWFLLSEIGNSYLRVNNYNMALLYLLRGACTKDPEKMKVGLYESIGDACALIGDEDLSQLSFLLAKNIREENGWFINNQLRQKIKKDKIVSIRDVRKRLIEKLYLISGENIGKISKLFSQNSGGFIQTDKKSYYFQSKNFFGKVDSLKVGDSVKFIIVDSFDKKKQKNTLEASVITPIKKLYSLTSDNMEL